MVTPPNDGSIELPATPGPVHDEHDYDPRSACERCRIRIPFEFPQRLVDEALAGRVVIFAGAGISTESPLVFPSTLYHEIGKELGLDSTEAVAFPAVMERFETREGRPELVQRIRKRLDYVDSFPRLRWAATEFHRELATLFPINEIVTTNWDTYFEDECGATPIVTADDYGFWSLPGRKVFKIHGSINNVGSLIATNADYDECYKALQSGVMGGSLKHLLATKTIVFLGYSFRDEDFNRLYRLLRKELGRMVPRSYIVTLDSGFDASAYDGASLIQTSGAYFVERFKEGLAQTHHFVPDERFDAVDDLLDDVEHAHHELFEQFPLRRFPLALYVAMYQDGLGDSLQRIVARRKTGEYSHACDVKTKMNSYDELRKRLLRRRKYHDVAYAEGYLNGLLFLIQPTKTGSTSR